MPTTYMGLNLPVPGSDSGTWDDKNNAALTLVDSHDHTSAKGIKVPTAGININADLAVNSNALAAVKTVRMDSQAAALAGADDKRNIYSINGDLYYNNAAGLPIQITTGNAIATPPATVSTVYFQHTFDLSGPYSGANGGVFPATDQGPRFIAPINLTITDVTIFSKTQGTSGTTELDLYKSSSGGAYTSIFSVTPKAAFNVAANTWVSTGTTATGYTPPELLTLQAFMTAGQALRIDIVSVQAGAPADIYLTIKYRAT